MKMDKLRFIGASSVDLPLMGATPSGPFVLKGAEGLGPPEISVRMARTVLEKAVYQGKSASLRQIIAVAGLQPNWDIGQTAEELRTQLYSLLSPKNGSMVRAEIISAGVVQGYAQGQLSKFETALFTQDPAVQIVLDCDYPYFLHPTTITQQPAPSLVNGALEFEVANVGTAPSGFRAGFVLGANVGTTLAMSGENPFGPRFQIDGINWVTGDRFVIDTRAGSRGVWRGPAGGALVSVLNNMNAQVSEWLQLHGGNNKLRLGTTAFSWDSAYKFQHQPAYWGV